MSTGRLEAFSDGVFAIAITLLSWVTIPAAQIHRRSRVFAVVAPVYAVSTAIAFVNAEAVLVLNAALAIYYAFAGFRVGDEVAR